MEQTKGLNSGPSRPMRNTDLALMSYTKHILSNGDSPHYGIETKGLSLSQNEYAINLPFNLDEIDTFSKVA